MKVFAFSLLLVSVSVCAQVKVCVDAKGKKTFTDYECEKIGMQRSDTIKDIDITPKQCPAIRDQIANSKVAIARHDATNMNVLNVGAPIYRNLLVQQLEANQLRYSRECER